MEEVFKTIKGFENLYEISNLGRVKNLSNGKILKNTLHKTGYYHLGLSKKGKESKKRINVLIASAFIPNPENKRCVDHIDKDKTNNNIDNLRWATHSQNRMNSNLSSDNKSGYSGVYFRKDTKNWQARLMVDGKYYSKNFKTKEEAIKYRADLERIHFGIYSPNYKPPVTIINNITNNITIQNVQTFNNIPVKTEAQEIEELEKELELSMK